VQSLPTQIGRYEILGLLGTGGMAEVFLGRLNGPSGFERPVVIKRILPHLAREQQFVDMFLDEARIVAGIRHQNVVTVHELGTDGDELFLVMEYLEGESLAGLARRLSRQRKLLSFGLCAHVMAEVCAGLHAAHELTNVDGRTMNLVHRDVSPANIFVTYSGEVKILDFGIAVAADRVSKTEVGQVKGKYAYMSPEQCHGKDLDRRSDLFSLGTVLYELATCRRLFKRANDVATIQAICNDDAPSPAKLLPSYPASLERITMKALARKRADRYQTALEMRRELLHASNELNGGKIPEESLARVMHKLFMDRIEQKRGMLARIRDGREITNVPSAETDSQIELPAISTSSEAMILPESQSQSSVSVISHSALAPKAPHRKAWVAGAIAAGLVVIAGTAALTTWSTGSADAQDAPTIVETPPESPAPRIKLQIVSEPAGARVLVAGLARGETPTTVELERAERRIDVVVEKQGFVTVTQAMTPNIDQLIQVSLVEDKPIAETPKAPARKGRRRKAPEKPEGEESPYTRFN
jgi:serine/threonine-protein kinase